MNYIMSDIHGYYNLFVEMCDKIAFSPYDDLYVLGDIIDRGPEPIRLLQKVMNAPNIHVLTGNHEAIAVQNFRYGVGGPLDESALYLPPEAHRKYSLWVHIGGETTLEQFKKISSLEERISIKKWMQDLPLYHEVEINGNSYVFVHAGIDNYHPSRELSEYTKDELIWYPPETLDMPLFKEENKFLVFGHTPTFCLAGGHAGKIFMKNGYIGIDCGASYQEFGGRLGCLCLDTMEEFYV